MMDKRCLRGVMTAAVLVALPGCFSLSRTEPPQRSYVLGGERVVQVTARSPGDLTGLTVGVRRPRLASYLEGSLLAVRRGPNEVTYAEFHRWGEPLGGGINRVVASQLAARAAIRAVDVAPWPAGERYDYLVQLHVEHFEGLAPEDVAQLVGEAHLRISWEILRQRDGVVLARGATEHREPAWVVGDYGGLVRSLDGGLTVLTEDLARTLSDLGVPSE
jgi:uncharacterized protein